MIGFQLLVIETESGFIADKVDSFFSVGLKLLEDKPKHLKKEAGRMYDSFGEYPENEFELSKDELNSISQAKTSNKAYVGKPIYHDLACDGIIIIPKTKDKFLSWKGFKELKVQ
jgi:hypothetical protein